MIRRKEALHLLQMDKMDIVNELTNIIVSKDNNKIKWKHIVELLLKSNIIGAVLGWFLQYAFL